MLEYNRFNRRNIPDCCDKLSLEAVRNQPYVFKHVRRCALEGTLEWRLEEKCILQYGNALLMLGRYPGGYSRGLQCRCSFMTVKYRPSCGLTLLTIGKFNVPRQLALVI